MTSHDDERPGVSQSVPNRRAVPRRAQVAAGVTGLAVLLGGGAYLITDRIVNRDDSATTRDVGALAPVAPVVPSESLPPSAAPSTSASGSPAATTSAAATSASPPAKTSASPAEVPDAVRKQIQAARDAAAKDGFPLQRPLPQRGKVVPESQISTRTEKTSGGTMRITSAKADLSGNHDRVLAADDGTPAGNARCTQQVHFSVDAPPRVIPNLLLCWRISATRSVVTFAVATKGRPSAADSAAVIDREWAKLG